MITCTSPLHVFTVGYDKSGQPIKKVTSGEVKEYCGSLDYQEIPCGHCLACRLARSREWANRCMLELQYYESAYFVTLTYDDEHLPLNEYVTEDGEVCQSATLVKKDFQLFIKRLRKRFCNGQEGQSKIRYYACGEYGSQTLRPHYHCIIFGLKLDDLRLYKQSRLGDNYYNSASLDKVWNKGYAVVGDVTWDTCAYTARYIVKKKLGPDGAKWYEKYHLEPEFTLMSLKPAIGRRYYDEYVDSLFDSSTISVPARDGARTFTIPYYFKRLREQEQPGCFEELKEINRNVVKTRRRLISSGFGLYDDGYYDVLKTQDENLKEKTKSLARKEI